MNLPVIKLAAIKHKLQWSAEGEWSAYLTPEECHLVLRELEKPRKTGRIIHGDNTNPEGKHGRDGIRGTGQRCHDVP